MVLAVLRCCCACAASPITYCVGVKANTAGVPRLPCSLAITSLPVALHTPT